MFIKFGSMHDSRNKITKPKSKLFRKIIFILVLVI